MLDREFFEKTLVDHVGEKGKFSSSGVTVRIRLVTGESLAVNSLVEATPSCVVLEVYDEDGKLREYPQEQRDLGAPLTDLDRVAFPYEVIANVRVTTNAPKDKTTGFRMK